MPRGHATVARERRERAEARRAGSVGEEIPSTLTEAREQAAHCTRCPLYRDATQTVFGEGLKSARLMLIGEQPGDKEDIEGQPFVGPAGRMLDKALQEARIERGQVFLTNAVKHFKFTQRGKRRLHKKPDAGEIEACRWWLDLELKFVDPVVMVTLGTTALRSVLRKPTAISRLRGTVVEVEGGRDLVATVHPSLLLRIPDRDKAREEYARFVGDLKLARKAAGAP